MCDINDNDYVNCAECLNLRINSETGEIHCPYEDECNISNYKDGEKFLSRPKFEQKGEQ